MNKLSTTICAAVMSALPLYNAAANKVGEPMPTFGQEFFQGAELIQDSQHGNMMFKYFKAKNYEWRAIQVHTLCNNKYNEKPYNENPFLVLKIEKNGDVRTGNFYLDYLSKDEKKESDGITDLVETMAERDSDFLVQVQEFNKKIPPCQPEVEPKQ